MPSQSTTSFAPQPAEQVVVLDGERDAVADVLAEPGIDRPGVAAPHHQVDAAVGQVLQLRIVLGDRTGSVVVIRVVEVERISRFVCAAMNASVVVGAEGMKGGLWCSPVAKTSSPTSSALSAIAIVP